jgi:hypothetical protein
MLIESVITCPYCGTAKAETMPTNACQFFYECTGCGAMLQPKPGCCCVFCSYGSMLDQSTTSIAAHYYVRWIGSGVFVDAS